MVKDEETIDFSTDEFGETSNFEEPKDFNVSSNDFNTEGNSAVMKNFFDTTQFLSDFKKELQGQVKGPDGRYMWPENPQPVAADDFIDDLVNSLRSVINQHSSVSAMSGPKADRILLEKFMAFAKAVVEEPFFKEEKYYLLSENFDHALELFMGLVVEAHGTHVATSLQAGVVAEYNDPNKNNQSMFDKARAMIK